MSVLEITLGSQNFNVDFGNTDFPTIDIDPKGTIPAGSEGQVVGYDANGNLMAVDLIGTVLSKGDW